MAKLFNLGRSLQSPRCWLLVAAGPEKKLGRGFNNLYEPIRLAEMRRSIEQTCSATLGDVNYHTGIIRGFNRTIARTGIGIWEIVSSPFRRMIRSAMSYLNPKLAYPDSYQARLV